MYSSVCTQMVSVNVDDTHQSMLGFGAALTGSSAYLLHNSPHKYVPQLPPANEVGRGNVFIGVCLFTGRVGSGPPPPTLPPSRTIPPAPTYGGQAGGTHPTGMLSCFRMQLGINLTTKGSCQVQFHSIPQDLG